MESSQFGIRTLLIEPGMIRTKIFTLQNIKVQKESESIDEDWKSFVANAAELPNSLDGNQPGDAVKLAERVVDLVRNEGVAKGKTVPLRMPFGQDALEMIKKKCLDTLKLLEDWEDVIVSTERDE